MFKVPKQCSIPLAMSGLLLVVANTAQASTYTGAVSKVLAQPSTIAPLTQTRFSKLQLVQLALLRRPAPRPQHMLF
jgi:hypothetical protein